MHKAIPEGPYRGQKSIHSIKTRPYYSATETEKDFMLLICRRFWRQAFRIHTRGPSLQT
jgi:hypothetical protein